MDTDLATLADAYADGDVPRIWTPAHVYLRLVEAFAVVRRTPMRIGPQAYGSNWPSVMREFADGVSADEQEAGWLETFMTRVEKETMKRPTAMETSRADEALAWCVRHLADDPTECDALQVSAMVEAFDLSLERVLRERRLAADVLIARREPEAGAKIIDRDAARAAAAKIAAWADERLAKAKGPQTRARIAAAAKIRFRRELAASGAIAAQPRRVRRSEVMAGRCFSQSYLSMKRREAAARLANALNEAGVPVR